MIEFIPIRHRILLKKLADSKKTKSGLGLTDDITYHLAKGIVLTVEEEKINEDGKFLPMVIKKRNTKTTREKHKICNYLTWEEYSYNCLPSVMLMFRNNQSQSNTCYPDGKKIAISFNIGLI